MNIGLLTAVFFIMVSCENTSTSIKPTNILDEETFTDILVDFCLAESAANTNIKSVAAVQFDSAYAFNPLIEHGIRKGQYDSTLLYYSENTDLYKKVYDDVLAQLIEIHARRQK
jgi:hypothetical protein